jgi:Chromo (CHRromatin Organisation MOdifier) domain
MLRHSQSQYKKWYNKGRKAVELAKDDWVLVSTKHLRQRRPCRKLADKFIGPYQVEKVVGDHGLAYKLRLPSSVRVHPTFPVTSLEPYRARSGEEPASPTDNPLVAETSYEVEAILAHKGPRWNRYYLIKWKDYDDSEVSWEPRRNLDDGPLLQAYDATIQETVGQSRRKRARKQ